MALPVVQSLVDCANYTNTVEPYLYQLKPLPQILLQSITNPLALKQIYLDTNPLITGLAFSLAIAPIFLVVSEINKNYSQVDRFWSILPTVYNVHYVVWAHLAGLRTEKMDLLLVVSTLWSTRLTFNYWRKGGYTVGSEDYRWEIVKKYIGPTVFFLFNVTFISTIQSLLLFSITTPSYILLLTSRIATLKNETPLELGDIIAAGIMMSFITISAIADQQQWNYQNAKQEYKKTGRVITGFTREELERGFRTSHLFALSRHPNFAAEQSVWVSLHAWSCYSSMTTYNWTGCGALAYLVLFQGSTWLTELLTSQKYPDYKQYKQQVGMFIPGLGSKTPTFQKQIQANKVMDEDAMKARQRYDLR